MSLVAIPSRFIFTTPVRKQSSLTAASSSSSIYEPGDLVELTNDDGNKVRGTIKERRGGGWYSILLRSSTEKGRSPVVKRRAGQLTLLAHDSTSDRNNNYVTNKRTLRDPFNSYQEEHFTPKSIPPPPTIIDLDAAIQSLHTNEDVILNKRDRQYLEQCAHHASYDRWVVFSDLHCAPSTLDVSIQILDRVHSIALEREAGVLFLGDFWHHRGTVRVDCLNAVLHAFSTWQVPLVMIPGNHDQVTLSGSEHALTPFQNAYRIEGNNFDGTAETTYPGPLIFSHPTKFRDALFVPHIRDVAVMESILQSDTAHESSALFIHADVTGAYMNDLIVSQGGVSPSSFPPNRPIYSGHFHKPHNVTATQSAPGVIIQYVGSPYETSLAEASQSKRLLVLDANQNWTCVETIPMNIGRKHFRVTSVRQLLDIVIRDDESKRRMSGQDDKSSSNSTISSSSVTSSRIGSEDDLFGQVVSSGDRVVISVPAKELEQIRRNTESGVMSEFDDKVKRLRKAGASVEIREIKMVPTGPMMMGRKEKEEEEVTSEGGIASSHNGGAFADVIEDMNPPATFAVYLEEEARREAMTNETATLLLEAGTALLEEVSDGPVFSSRENGSGMSSGDGSISSMSTLNATTDLILDSVTVQGFGPFKESTTYPLRDRGLVLIRGVNNDGGFDSNGSGKSTLAMSALWALTGSADPRPLQDAKVADVVNDFSKTARVSVRGTINSEPFTITRSKTASRTGLTFHLGDEDLTRQSAKETQMVIDETLGVGSQILARTIFHGQHSLNGLLEATDAKLKEELSLIVPLTLWQEAAVLARSKSRAASKNAAKLDGMISVRTTDLEAISRRRDLAKEAASVKHNALMEKQAQAREQVNEVMQSYATESSSEDSLDSFQKELEDAATSLKELESTLQQLASERKAEIVLLRSELNDLSTAVNSARNDLQLCERSFDRAEMKVASAESSLKDVKMKWNIEQAPGSLKATITSPQVCPTCKQPISDDGVGHSHENIVATIEKELSASLHNLDEARVELDSATRARDIKTKDLSVLEAAFNDAAIKSNETEDEWEKKLAQIEKRLVDARARQAQRSLEFSKAAQRIQQMSQIKSMQAKTEAELERFREAAQSSAAVYEEICGEVEEKETNIRELQKEKAAEISQSSIMTNLAEAFGPRGVQTFVLQHAVHALQQSCQSYLDELSDGSQKLDLSLDAGDRISRTAFIRGPDGELIERPLSSLSGGQWRRCSLAMSLGFSDLVARRGRLRPSLLVLDEPLTHLDSSGRSNVGKLLRMLLRRNSNDFNPFGQTGLSVDTILMILQDLAAEEIEECFDHIDEVIKTGGASKVAIDEEYKI